MASDKLFFFLFQSNPDLILRWLDDLPAVILEAQMAADPNFQLRLYAETGRFLQQQALNFGNSTPIQEFLDRRVLWVELQPLDGQLPASPLTRVLSLLLQPEGMVRSVSDALREQALSDPRAAEVLPLIPAIISQGSATGLYRRSARWLESLLKTSRRAGLTRRSLASARPAEKPALKLSEKPR